MDVPTDWWKTFFSGLSLEMWRAVTSQEMTKREADFLVRQLAVEPGAAVLDIPCGGGRLAIELAARGYAMTGVDFAGEFIEEARAEAARRRLNVHWHQADMREVDWQEAFDAAFCFGNSFGYLEDDENLRFLRAVARALKPGARFAMETWCTELAARHFQERSWFQTGELRMLEENDYDLLRGRIHTEYTFISGDRQECKRGVQRIYSLAELRGLLEAAGFTEIRALGSLDGEPVGLDSHRLLILAARQAQTPV